MQTIDAGLFWQLPGPRSFIDKVSSAVSSRVLIINTPWRLMPGTMEGVQRGIQNAHMHHPITLNISSNTNIADEVGAHFPDHSPHLTAAELAKIQSPTPTIVFLLAINEAAQEKCEIYTKEFMSTSDRFDGSVHLVSTIHDEKHQQDGRINKVRLLTFDGGLNSEEMEAYVSLRMMSRPGPGSTRLLRAIASEYAGYDTVFAERIMSMEDSQILAIRDQLGMLMGEDHDRWRTQSWLSGSQSHVSDCSHVLYEYYLQEHGDRKQKDLARSSIERRYWRASLKVITPWLEERRMNVISVFEPQLRKIAVKGKIEIPTGKDYSKQSDPLELEYNNIVGLCNHREIHAQSEEERLALAICKGAKIVRDDIAHLRVPKTEDLLKLIQGMDSYLQSKKRPY